MSHLYLPSFSLTFLGVRLTLVKISVHIAFSMTQVTLHSILLLVHVTFLHSFPLCWWHLGDFAICLVFCLSCVFWKALTHTVTTQPICHPIVTDSSLLSLVCVHSKSMHNRPAVVVAMIIQIPMWHCLYMASFVVQEEKRQTEFSS